MSSSKQLRRRRLQFKLWQLLLVVTVAAVGFAVIQWWPIGSKVLVLRYGNAQQRYWAAEALGSMGAGAAPAAEALIEALGDRRSTVQGAASRALAAIGPEVVPTLVRALDDERPEVRRLAIWTLQSFPGAADERLLDVMGDEHPLVRRQAAQFLSRFRTEAAESLPVLARGLRDPDSSVQILCAQALSNFRASALAARPALLEATRDSDAAVREAALRALVYVGVDPSMAEPVLDALRDEADGVRTAAQSVLSSLGSIPLDHPALSTMLHDERPTVRVAAVRVIGNTGVKSGRVVSMLIEALDDPDQRVRLVAARVLGRSGAAAEPAVEELTSALNDPDARVRRSAAEALRVIGAAASPALPELVEALDDENAGVRAAAIAALSQIRPEPRSVVGPLRKALGDEVEWVRHSAALALVSMSYVDAEACVPALIDALRSGEQGPRTSAREALYWLDATSVSIQSDRAAASTVVPELTDALGDPNPEVRWTAAWLLSKEGSHSEQVTRVLIEAVRDGRGWDRLRAAEALGDLGSAANVALPVLSETLQQIDPLGRLTPRPLQRRFVARGAGMSGLRGKEHTVWVLRQAIRKIDPDQPLPGGSS